MAQKDPPRRIIVQGREEAEAALRAARRLDRPVSLETPPGGAGAGGALYWIEVFRQAGEAVPEARFSGVIDAAGDAGLAMACLRAGARAVRFTGRADIQEKLASMARATGASLLPADAAGSDEESPLVVADIRTRADDAALVEALVSCCGGDG